jgi:hypothetical protein
VSVSGIQRPFARARCPAIGPAFQVPLRDPGSFQGASTGRAEINDVAPKQLGHHCPRYAGQIGRLGGARMPSGFRGIHRSDLGASAAIQEQ